MSILSVISLRREHLGQAGVSALNQIVVMFDAGGLQPKTGE